MTTMSQKILDYMQQEYKKRVSNNSNITDDSTRCFSQEELCKSLNLNIDTIEEATSELKSYGYIEKWINGVVKLLED